MKLAGCQSKKKLLIGVDEAGYGPNLGPLLIGGSAWLVPQELGEIEFSRLLADSFHTSAWSAGCRHVPLGDSKKLYQAGSGLRSLEIGLLSMLSSIGQRADDLESFLRLVSADQLSAPGNPPWYHTISAIDVPSDPSFVAEIDRLRQVAIEKLDQHEMELLACRATILTEPEFNQRVTQCDSKGRVLSLATLDLVSKLLRTHECERAEIYCDRQGGRKNYLPLLLEWMPDSWFVETGQSSTRCSYRTTASPQLEIHFTVGGDSFPPTALASMIAKYLRERLMEAFNDYWAKLCPSLKPTAGYPQDAQRFRQTIEPIAQQNSLAAETWWRVK